MNQPIEKPNLDNDYWLKRLREAEPLNLSIRGLRGASDRRVPRAERELSGPAFHAVESVAEGAGVRPFTICLAALKALLMRWSGQDDVVVGVTLGQPATEAFPLRTDLSANPTFREAILRSQQGIDAALLHAESAFVAFTAPADSEGSPRANPLFNVMVHEASAPVTAGRLPIGAVIDVHIVAEGRAIRCTFSSAAVACDEATLNALAEQYVHLLGQASLRPDLALAAHCLVTESARPLLADATVPLGRAEFVDVIAQFRESAQRTPDAPALRFGSRVWSYRELERCTIAVAERLRALGAGPGSAVALQGQRSPGLVAAMTATAMCGAVFVVLDPSLPKARRELMIRDSRASLLCRIEEPGAPLGDDLLDGPGLATLRIDPELREIAALGADGSAWPPVRLGAQDAICVVFTSGSTGQPKPVLASHKGLAHLVQWHAAQFGIRPADHVSWLSSLSFGTLLRDVYLPLCSGATLCIPQQADLSDPLAWCAREGVTIVHSTPTVLASWLRQCGDFAPEISIRWVCVAGEPLSDSLVRAWRCKFPANPGFANLYGLTESSLAKCCYLVPDEVEPGLQPVGRSLPGVQVLVLGPTGGPCGIGERGEIAIRTPYLSLGYLGLQEETERRFRPNPQRDDADDLLYFTGDVGWYRADGQLELAGRLDDQIKIRGVRVEPAEVAAVFAGIAGVKQCVVLARSPEAGEPSVLTAYVACDETSRSSAQAMRRQVAALLPSALVPGAFVLMTDLPRLPNGKVDRAALPPPNMQASQGTEQTAPRDANEQTIWQAWSEVLDAQEFGVHENFFDLGGHSLLAMQMLSRLRDSLGVELPLRALFDAPTVAELAEQVRSAVYRPVTNVPIARLSDRERAGLLPLSAAQQRMVFWHRFVPGTALYNVPVVLTLRGALEPEVLQECLRGLMRRHDVLRSRWVLSDAAPMQRFEPMDKWKMTCVALDAIAQGRTQRYEELSAREAQAGFDLTREAPMRATLVTLDAQDHRLLWTLHHSVCDGWSVDVLVNELCDLYEAATQRRSAALPDPGLQYADYAAWQRRLLDGGLRERELTYWTRQLQDAPPVVELPTDRARPAVQRFRGARIPIALSSSELAALRGLVRRTETTLFVALFAAWQALLHRYSSQPAVTTGTVVANRDRYEVQRTVGYFANTLALRSDFHDELTVAGLLAQVKETTLAAYEHQHVPFEEVIDALKLPRNSSHMPLIQTVVVLQAPESAERDLGPLQVRRGSLSSPGAKFDLTLELRERGNELHGCIEYDTDLFDRETVERLAGHWLSAVRSMCANPEQLVAKLPLLSRAERNRVLVEWNATQRHYPARSGVSRIFEARAAEQPDRVAAVERDRGLSYGELNAKANRLAHHLIAQGVARGDFIAVAIERSIELVVAQLAVLKCGAAYVPIEPNAPASRQEFILDDCGCQILLIRQGDRSPSRSGLLRIDVDLALEGEHSEHDPEVAVSGETAAYVMYTSGSTGRPKGVIVPHRGIARLVLNNGFADFAPGDRFAFVANPAFDASTFEVWAPLLNGGRVVVIDQATLLDPARLAQELIDQSVNALLLTVGLFNQYADDLAEALRRLRFLFVGGDVLDPRVIGRVLRQARPRHLFNAYGPTESTTIATAFAIDSVADDATSIPIGHPISNTRTYVLDLHGEPVPIGVTGELWIGGDGLALGYLNRAELTAKRFVRDRFVADPQARIYRTGDLARYRADGVIEFMGRNDTQVKLRGFRIELGEIEAQLATCPGVANCAVVARDPGTAQMRLVAYFTREAGSSEDLDPWNLRQRLLALLPEHMVPAAFVELAELPLTRNGKLDRHALPIPPMQAYAARRHEPPQGELEEDLAEVWVSVLRVERVGRHDNFFELGGHSLLATQVQSRIRSALKIEFALRALFDHPTLAGLAAHLEAARLLKAAAATASGMVRAGSSEQGARLPTSFSQRRMWLVQQINPTTSAYNVRIALRLRGTLDVESLRGAIDLVVQRHGAFRTRFELVDGEPIQVIDAARSPRIDIVDLSATPAHQREDEAQRILSDSTTRPFDLSVSGLYRSHLVRFSDDEHALFLVMHHAITDQWSNGIVVREIGVAYSKLVRGEPANLPALPISYADYAAWQRGGARQAEIARQTAHWRERLHGLEPLNLPYDLPARGLPTGNGSGVTEQFEPAAYEALQRLSAQHGATIFMTLLACFKLLLARLTGQTDVAVGSPVANRNRLELEPLVGTMVNTLVHRTDISSVASFSELLAGVKESTLEAFANQDAPFERLVEELGADRVASRSPLVTVLFNVANAPKGYDAWSDLDVTAIHYESVAAQFDLGLTVEPGPTGMIRLNYSSDVFVRSTAQRMLASFLGLLEQVCTDPTRPLREYDVIGAAQRDELAHWNDTAVTPARTGRIDQLIAAGVARNPTKIALRSESGFLSYAELRSRSHRLARHLRSLGIARGALVGLCVERSLDMVIAQLAILHAGAAYVPLDPAYPSERLAAMASDARLAALVTDSSLEHVLDWPSDRRILLDLDAARIAALEASELAPDAELDATAEDAAYVIYTSGSTGKPKGVVVPHGAVVNFLTSMAREPGIDSSDVIVAVTTLSFDIAVLELLAPLSVGAQVIIARREEVVDGRSLRVLVEQHGATMLQATPSSWRLLVDAGWQGSRRFKALIGGEALPLDLAQQLLARCGELWNMYGPTETTVWSTCWQVVRPELGVSIGTPIANTQVHVLDGHGQLCPIGAVGEIYIGGAGVATGYLNRPELTRERFVDDPFRAGGRLYRTGDRGRWRHDGLLEHLGRLDHQVKVRGHRIELGEIEATLTTHPQVAHATVIVREDRPGDVRLVAYIVPKGEAATPNALREHLRETLPDYMLPQHYVKLGTLPLLPNGKLNRQALPAPNVELLRLGQQAEEDAPRAPLEVGIAGIWQDLLGVPQVSLRDNFFELGGHSLLAMRAIQETEKRLGVTLTLRSMIFESLGQLSRGTTVVAEAAVPATTSVGLPAKEGVLRRLLRAVVDLPRT